MRAMKPTIEKPYIKGIPNEEKIALKYIPFSQKASLVAEIDFEENTYVQPERQLDEGPPQKDAITMTCTSFDDLYNERNFQVNGVPLLDGKARFAHTKMQWEQLERRLLFLRAQFIGEYSKSEVERQKEAERLAKYTFVLAVENELSQLRKLATDIIYDTYPSIHAATTIIQNLLLQIEIRKRNT